MQCTGISDFDFFIGSWVVKHSRLKDRLVQSNEWVSFDGSVVTQKILGGFGNFDDNILHLPEGDYNAVTIRTFDPKLKTWSIWWLDGRTPGALDAPMVGQFSNGIGTFFSDDFFNGRKIKVRFLWSVAENGCPRWEQAFSENQGQDWETNWIMEFERAD